MFTRRLLLLIGLVLLVGFVTGAFAEGPVDRTTPGISRSEAVALVVAGDTSLQPRVDWYRSHMPPLPLYKDIKQTDWFAPYLEVAFERGYIAGNASRLFKPDRLMKIEEAAMLTTRIKNKGEEEIVLYLPGTHTDASWYGVPLQAAVTDGIPMPTPTIVGAPVARIHFYTMLQAVGITHPGSVPFADTVIAQSPVNQSASTTMNLIRTTSVVAHVLRPLTQGSVSPLRAPAPRPRTTPAVAQVANPPAASKSFSISLPTLGISDLHVSHPGDPFSHDGLLAPLKSGVGHLFSYPGTNGKILIYGHSSGYPWDVSSYTKIFRQINKLNVGDTVVVHYDGVEHRYQVTYKETVPAKDMSAYKNTGSEELILYTCWPPDSISQRYLVHAKPTQTVAAK